MLRHYFIHRAAKAVFHSEKSEPPKLDNDSITLDYLGSNLHPNPKMAVVFFLGNVSGYSITDLDRRESK